jgi:cytidine diphosphoramidate kinase
VTTEAGHLYWITGLAGAGKSTIGSALYERIHATKPNVVFLDGDALRSVFGSLHGHTLEERKLLGLSYARLCKMLTDQGHDVVCATMSLFKDVQDFNRANISRYHQIFIDCEMEELVLRDQKGIYSKALRGELSDVMGVNLPFDRPEDCALVIDNRCKDRLECKVQRILDLNED